MKCVYVLDNMQLSTNQDIQRLIVSKGDMCHGKFCVWINFSVVAPWNKCDYIKCKFPVVSLTFLSLCLRMVTTKWALQGQAETLRSVMIAVTISVEV